CWRPRRRAPAEEGLGPPSSDDSLAVLERYGISPEIARARIDAERAQLDLALARRRRETRLTLALDTGLWGSDLTSSVPEELRATNPDATFADRLRRDLGASAALTFHLPVVDPAAPHDVSGRVAAAEAAVRRSLAAES